MNMNMNMTMTMTMTMNNPNKHSTTEELAQWNDSMVKKYHNEGILFESKNPILRKLEVMRLKKMIKLSNIKPGQKLLDLGCGEGYFISLLPNNIEIVGLDISKIALKRAKKILKSKNNITLQFGNALSTGLSDKSFDIITCSEVLEHVPEPKKIIKEIFRLLKDDGTAVISVPDENRIKLIMRIIKFFRIDAFLHSARKQEDYDWHLHEADKKFIFEITKNYFTTQNIFRVPPLIGHRFVASLKKISK